MTMLEIVHVRCLRDRDGATAESLAAAIAAETVGERGRVVVYRRNDVASDLAIHIRHRRPASASPPCPLASRLATALREVGLVEYSVWTEVGGAKEVDDAT